MAEIHLLANGLRQFHNLQMESIQVSDDQQRMELIVKKVTGNVRRATQKQSKGSHTKLKY